MAHRLSSINASARMSGCSGVFSTRPISTSLWSSFSSTDAELPITASTRRPVPLLEPFQQLRQMWVPMVMLDPTRRMPMASQLRIFFSISSNSPTMWTA